MKRVGLAATIPYEMVLASGGILTHMAWDCALRPEKASWAEEADRAGLPRTMPSIPRMIYGMARVDGFDLLICPVSAESRDLVTVCEVLESEGQEVIFFSFPYGRDDKELQRSMKQLARALGTKVEAGRSVWEILRPVRRRIRSAEERIGELGFSEALATLKSIGQACAPPPEWLSGDFEAGDALLSGLPAPEHEEQELGMDAEVEDLGSREPELADQEVAGEVAPLRIAVVGFAGMYLDVCGAIFDQGGRVVHSEFLYQAALLEEAVDFTDQYRRFTLPYGMKRRLEPLHSMVRDRGVEGIVHLCQAFSHHGIDDLLLRRELGLPTLTLEEDEWGALRPQDRMRLEAFVGQVRSA